MTIDVIGTLADLESLRGEWLALWERCPAATPFQSPQWLLPWVRHRFGGGRILVVAVRQGGELIGLAPLFVWGIGQRTVSFLGAGVSDYGDVLFAPGRDDECVSAIRRLWGEWDEMDLQEIPGGSALLKAWSGDPCSVCPVLDLSTYPDSMDRKHRVDVRRAGNRLSREPGFEFAMTADLRDFFRLYEARWGAMDQPLCRFHGEVAEAFRATGHLRSFVLRTAHGPAAAVYAFACRETLYCYLSGFDPKMAKLSPGAVLLGWAIERSIAEGLRGVDFLRQPEPYKYLWGARDRVNYAVRTSE